MVLAAAEFKDYLLASRKLLEASRQQWGQTMPFHIRDPETDALARELAQLRGVGLTEAVREAVRKDLQDRKEAEEEPLRVRLRRLADEVAKYPKTGLKADKAFFDELSVD